MMFADERIGREIGRRAACRAGATDKRLPDLPGRTARRSIAA